MHIKKKSQKSYQWKSNARRYRGLFGDEQYSKIKDEPSEYLLYLCIQFYKGMILRCINQSNLCFALQDINPSKLYYLLSVIKSILGGRSTTEYGKAVKPVCRLHNRYTSAQNLDDKTQGFYRISTCQENTLYFMGKGCSVSL